MNAVGLATLANLSACAYVLQGAEWYRTRDRVRLGLGGLKKMGEVWPCASKDERRVKGVARGVFSMPRVGERQIVNGGIESIEHQLAGQDFGFPLAGNDLTGFEDLGGIDYLAMLENSQSGNRMHNC